MLLIKMEIKITTSMIIWTVVSLPNIFSGLRLDRSTLKLSKRELESGLTAGGSKSSLNILSMYDLLGDSPWIFVFGSLSKHM